MNKPLPSKLLALPGLRIGPLVIWCGMSMPLAVQAHLRITMSDAFREGRTHGEALLAGKRLYWCLAEARQLAATYSHGRMGTTVRIAAPDVEVIDVQVVALQQALAALEPFANLFKGDLQNVIGTTEVNPTITVQMIKDAKAATRDLLALLKPVPQEAQAA